MNLREVTKAHEEAAEKCIPVKARQKRKAPWENFAVAEKRESLKAITKLKNEDPATENLKKHSNAQKELDQAYNSEQLKYVQHQIDEVESMHINKQASAAWQIVNNISGRKQSSQGKLKASSQDERLQKWKGHFQMLLGNTPTITDSPISKIIPQPLNIKTGPFDNEELERVLKRLKNGKASGLDNIPPEVWKTGNFNDILLKLCNEVYSQKRIQAWTEGCILPFPKKGDLGLTSNYRGITLTAIAAKIYNAMLLNRIQPEIEKVLRRNQNGFRKERSTTGQILTVRRILEGVRAKNLEAVLLFVDFSKAFDSVHRGKMKEILLAYGIPEETVEAIMMLYKNTRSPDGDTDFFDIQAGVLQGDTLAPFLFILSLDFVLQTSVDLHKELGLTLERARSRRYPAVKVTDADYADDLALFADKIADAEKLLHCLEAAAAVIGLHINAGKTEFMSINQEGQIKAMNNTPLKKVKQFTYLGSNIASTEQDVETRIAKAWGALKGLSTIWKSTLPESMKRDFFRATVESVLLYGSSTWTLTTKLENQQDGTFTRMLREILNISWKQHPTNQRLYGGIPVLTSTI